MECIDRKFKINAISLKSGKKYTQANSVLFLVKDALLPELLEKYYTLAVENGADERQLMGIKLLQERVATWQVIHAKQVHLPDVEPGKEEKRVCKENKV